MDKLRKIGVINIFLLIAMCLSTCLMIYFFNKKNIQQSVIHLELLILEIFALCAKRYIDKKHK